jgi:cytochrome b561
MGYYGGKGLPFFYKTFPGAEKPIGSIAKNAFTIHKNLGVYGKYLVPAHVGAAGLHVARGQPIFRRVNPFAKPRG